MRRHVRLDRNYSPYYDVLNCPFCGSEKILMGSDCKTHDGYSGVTNYFMFCVDCNCRGPLIGVSDSELVDNNDLRTSVSAMWETRS
jgi:transcription elongation factor Elf1